MTLTAFDVMLQAFALNPPVRRIYALFSGGKDSLVSTHFAMENGAHEVVHINTGIGIRQTREFVRETCKSFGWPLRELHPPQKTYRQFVLEKGFPGPGAHIYSYSWLKERALRKLVRETKETPKDRVMLVTGVRNLESARRMGYVKPIVRFGAQVWAAPVYNWNDIEMHAYRTDNILPLSEVSVRFGMSGECLCGAFAAPGEMKRLEAMYPEAAEEIHVLEAEVKAAGISNCEWGKRPKRGGQLSGDLPFMAMCVSCPTRTGGQ